MQLIDSERLLNFGGYFSGNALLEQEKAELSSNVKPVSAPPQIDIEQLNVCMKNLQKAIATDNYVEIIRIIRQCVEN